MVSLDAQREDPSAWALPGLLRFHLHPHLPGPAGKGGPRASPQPPTSLGKVSQLPESCFSPWISVNAARE